MTEPIKLTAGDFDYIHWEKDSGQELETFELMIYGKSELHCNEIKQQILENQEIVNDIKEIVTRNPQTDEDKVIIKCLKEILFENKNLNFKEILGEDN